MTSSDDVLSRRRSGKQRLSRTQLVAAAIELIDERGLAALTLRALAVRVDADPSALYRHFRNKDDLLAAVADAVLQEVDVTGPTSDEWRTTVRRSARRLRDVIRRRPGLAAVVASAPVTPSTVVTTGATFRILVDGAGLTERRAEHALATILAYVLGASLLEATPPSAARPPANESDDPAAELTRRIWYPTDREQDERFDQGLEWILDAVSAISGP